MLTDLIDVLDRRYAVVSGVPDHAYDQICAETYAFAGFLRSEPRLWAAFDDLCTDAVREVERVRRVDGELVEELRRIRAFLVKHYRKRTTPHAHRQAPSRSTRATNVAWRTSTGSSRVRVPASSIRSTQRT
jgi:hypothetical protein